MFGLAEIKNKTDCAIYARGEQIACSRSGEKKIPITHVSTVKTK